MQSAISIIRSVIGDKVPYEFVPGFRINQRYYLYGVLIIGDELHVMDVQEKWRQVQETEGEVIAALRDYFTAIQNYTEVRPKLKL